MAQMRTSYPDESQLMFMAFDLLHQDGCDAAVRAAQQATKTIPIIAVVDDIVAAGLIESLAKPGGNTTGVSILATELDGKRSPCADILLQALRSVFGTNVEWVGTIGAGPLLGVKRKLAYAPRQRGLSSVHDPRRPRRTSSAAGRWRILMVPWPW